MLLHRVPQWESRLHTISVQTAALLSELAYRLGWERKKDIQPRPTLGAPRSPPLYLIWLSFVVSLTKRMDNNPTWEMTKRQKLLKCFLVFSHTESVNISLAGVLLSQDPVLGHLWLSVGNHYSSYIIILSEGTFTLYLFGFFFSDLLGLPFDLNG